MLSLNYGQKRDIKSDLCLSLHAHLKTCMINYVKTTETTEIPPLNCLLEKLIALLGLPLVWATTIWFQGGEGADVAGCHPLERGTEFPV